MVKSEFINALKNTDLIKREDMDELQKVTREYPYFQAAKVLYLKSLKSAGAISYNQELKNTAAQTIDRTVLFDFITSPEMTSIEVNKEEIETPEELETVIDFQKNDNYSFSEWLKLGSLKPIKREPLASASKEEKNSGHMDLVNKFLASNPKMPKPQKSGGNNPIIEQKEETETNLMTETLAQVYLAQKKYDNAIIAYRILSLKNPEKSTFFADQIAKIELLKKNKS